jgi:ATP phosphoribosyltransferase
LCHTSFLYHYKNNMPVSLSNLSQILIFKVKSTASHHKKKLIFAVVMLLLGYIAKKKLTVGHVITFVESLTRIVQALPLPEAPRLRKMAEYEHPNTVPLKAIIDATKLEEIKKKCSRREAGW